MQYSQKSQMGGSVVGIEQLITEKAGFPTRKQEQEKETVPYTAKKNI